MEKNIRHFDAIYYKNVRLLVVRSLDNKGRDMLAMKVTMAYYKEHKRRPKPTIFFFTKVNNPMLCPITHLVALALANDAFEAPSLSTPRRVFEHKPTSLIYLGTATDAVRDQVMRHNSNSAVYNGAYINERMRFDVQSAVLERPSADGVLRMLTHMSLMRDPRAPIHVADDVLAALPPDPNITALKQKREKLKASAYKVQGTDVEAEVRRLITAISSAKSKH
ncbi:hypothetical protein IFR05_013980 [Cadophora sp. M221]|nr:hypothetical protein IFR05_013980 [Cadophora sp. M221]